MTLNNNPETLYQEFIHKSRYAKYLEDHQRREHWTETVDRYIKYIKSHVPKSVHEHVDEARQYIVAKEVMPSMRALMTAGEALDRDNTCGYNCSYLPIDDVKAFDETMFILMCGTGVGFSVERQYVSKLPEIPETLYDNDITIVVRDSKEGWSKAFRQLIALLYSGEVPKWDTSRVRPAGARLKKFGGRASGPEPLVELFEFTVNLFKQAAGRKLTSVECHDLMCKIGEVVVVGGVRRSAMISLSNLTDDRMRHAKSGEWWHQNGQRALANNSVCYTEKPDVGAFMREWVSLYDSHSGERGIFNRVASQKQAEQFGGRDSNYDFGTNPCSEIILRPYQFCNLTEVVIRPDDTKDTLRDKVRVASVLGSIQSTFTNFPYLRKIWQKNTEDERLLGVSLTGILDSPLTAGQSEEASRELPELLESLRDIARKTNKKMAKALKINESAAITCVKPSGTVSQLVDSASGIHARHSKYYLRTVRGDNKDPLTQFLKDAGVPAEPCVMKGDTTTVFTFPVKAPEACITRHDMTAMEHLELWKTYQLHWCEHKPSITVSVTEDEWPEVGAWVWNNFDIVSGISFLPYDGGTYRQAPYQETDPDTYNEYKTIMPTTINWEALIEQTDETVGSQELACAAGSCEIQ